MWDVTTMGRTSGGIVSTIGRIALVLGLSAGLVGCNAACGPGGAADERGALGQSCVSGSGCSGGLICDTSDPLFGLCTESCTSSEQCIESFGFGSFCIGANRCVRECVTDDDCLAGTTCDTEFRWCR